MDVGRDVKIGKKYLYGLEIFRGSKHLYFENVNSSDLSLSVLFFNFFFDVLRFTRTNVSSLLGKL